MQALDQIEDLLIRMGRRNLDVGAIRDDRGALRVVIPFPTWEDLLLLALDEIRSCGASSLQVMRRMNALIANLTEVLPPERHPALRHVARRLKGTLVRRDGSVVPIGGKTGTGDHRFDTYGRGGQVVSSRVVNRSATLVFLIGDR